MTRGLLPRRCALAGLTLIANLVAAQPGWAAPACPGNPDALGTSRTLVVDPREHARIGTMQYAETLPLQDHEVVLTFDDGPIPRHSNQVLDILAAECVKATFFVVGQMARAHPEGVRKYRDAGHTVGTHTQNHPLGMKKMPIDRAREEIEEGIAAVTAALGEAPAPFFRIPGLSRADAVETYAASQGLQVWSADFPADDWRHITPARVYELAMSRIEAKGKGILLLHDIQPRTAAALPEILRDLKARGYRIVHVVPARKDLPATPTDPQQWQMHPAVVAAARWPAVPGFAFARTETLPIPAMPQTELADGGLMLLPEPFDRVKRLARGAPLPIDRPWLQQQISQTVASVGDASLPVPGPTVFKMPDQAPTAVLTASSLTASRMTAAARRMPNGIPLTARASLEAGAARRAIPGSAPVTRPGLHR